MVMQKNIITSTCYTSLIIMFFIALFVNDIMVYKLVKIAGLSISAASLVFPITYLITDIIAETYGYRVSKRIIWLSVIFNIVFCALIALLIKLPSPSNWPLQSAFNSIFDSILYISLTHIVITPLSYLVNTYLISRWKIVVNGKYFIIRSIVSSAIGEFIFSAAMVFIIWHGKGFNVSLISLSLLTYLSKLTWNIVGSIPALFVVKIIKKIDHADVYDFNLRARKAVTSRITS